MFSKFFARKTKSAAAKTRDLGASVSYDQAKTLAHEGDEQSRVALAERGDLAPEILYFLAADPSPKVRKVLASNDAAPRHADLLLAKDKDEDVRGSLAEKVARLAPGLGADETDRLQQMTYDALSLLARDQAVRVRQILSEALREVADAPPDVIRRLAWDVEAAVATPVLMFSPVLTDQDLLEIIQAKPSRGSLGAISQRRDISVEITDAIVGSDDIDAIGLLLGNASAQIREETLDRVIGCAIDIDLWHMPLAMRPRLPSAAAVKIARFVAEDILEKLVAREDLSAETIKAVRQVVHKRLGDGEAKSGEKVQGAAETDPGMHIDDDEIFDIAVKKWAKGELDEKSLLQAMNNGEQKYAMAIVAVMADLPLRVVTRACASQSAKGCMAMAWRASLTAKAGEMIQQKLASLNPKEILRSVNGGFPLDDEALEWQIEFIRDL